MQIEKNRIVSLRYLVRKDKGEIVESIMDGPPVVYLHGDGTILPAMEAELDGLQPGDKISFSMSEEKGYTGINGDFWMEVTIVQVRPATDEELKNGFIPKQPEDCGPDCIC